MHRSLITFIKNCYDYIKMKPTTFNNMPIKILIDSCEIHFPSITSMYKDSILKCTFPPILKLAHIVSVHKQDECTDKSNYG